MYQRKKQKYHKFLASYFPELTKDEAYYIVEIMEQRELLEKCIVTTIYENQKEAKKSLKSGYEGAHLIEVESGKVAHII